MSKLIVLLCLFMPSLLIAKGHPFSKSYVSEIHEIFYDSMLSLSQFKVSSYQDKINNKRLELTGVDKSNQIKNLEIQNSILASKYSSKEAEELSEKIQEHEFSLAFDLIDQKLKNLTSIKGYSQQLVLINEILQLEGALRVEGKEFYAVKAVKNINSLVKKWKVSKVFNPENESTNLVNPLTGEYLSRQELNTLYHQGYDLSLLNPSLESSFWTQTDSHQFTGKGIALGSSHQLYNFKAEKFPDDGSKFYLDKVKRSSTKPKMNVYLKNSKGKKIKYKLKVGAELHSDPTAAALMLSLGFPADITQHRKNLKLVLKGSSYEEFKLDWESYYKRDSLRLRYPIENYISGKGKTKKGHDYIIFKEALLEAKPKKAERIGPWSVDDFDHSNFREVRALMLVQMWINNVDIKFDNNRLVLRKFKDDYKMFHINSDPGKSFGFFLLQEKPDAFWSDMISKNSSNEVAFKYYTASPLKIKNKATFSDIKWATRLIATLSREQITEAVKNGRWPDTCMEKLYIERLISRRNSLVRAFNLETEIDLISVNKSINENSLENVCGSSSENFSEISTTNFKHNWGVHLSPIFKAMRNAALDIATSAVNNTEKYKIQSYDNSHISVIAAPDRVIELNPNPKTADELYLVTDSMELGVNLQIGDIVFAENIYSKKYTLTYPVRSREEGRKRNTYIADIFLPLHLSKDKLPRKYVLSVDHFISIGGGVGSSKFSSLPVGAEAKISKNLLFRSIFDATSDNYYTVYSQKTKYMELEAELFAKAGLIKLPIYSNALRWDGRLHGKGLILERKGIASEKLDSIQNMIETADITGLEQEVQDFYIYSHFESRLKKINLVVWKKSRESTVDDIKIIRNGYENNFFQYTSFERNSYFVGYVETRDKKIDVFQSKESDSDALEMKIRLTQGDPHTKSKELERSYLKAINSLSLDEDKKIIPFSPETYQYSRNGLWGHTLTSIEIYYYKEALERLLTADLVEFEKSIVATVKVAPEELSEAEIQKLVTAQKLISNLKKVRRMPSGPEKIKKLIKSIRKALDTEKGFYNTHVLKLINQISGAENYYIKAVVSAPPFTEETFFEDQPLVGTFGTYRSEASEFINLEALTPSEHFNIFSSFY